MIGKIACFWGSPGSGKTTAALAVAAKLAAKKKNTIVVNCDRIIPALKIYAPTVKTNAQHSVGSLLMAGRFDDATLATKMIIHPDSDYICFLGLAPGDTQITYSLFERENIIKMLNRLSSSADYVLVDGSNYVVNDMLTLTTLELADITFRFITPDNKGILYLNSIKPIFQDLKFNFDKNIKILGNIKDISPVPETIQVVGNFDHFLAYSYEAESKFIGGELIQDLKRSSGIEFEEEISAIAERLLNFEQ